jgi:zinc protease
MEDLDRVDENDLKKFFLRWYGPNNAVLTVGGDVNPDNVVELVMKYFGPIRRGKDVQKAPCQIAILDGTRYIQYEDQVRQPQLTITYPSVPFHPDEPALDVLAHLLGYGKNSQLYKKLVKTSIASNVSASNATYELASEFGITLTGFPGTSLGKLDSLWEETLREFDKRNFTQQDINRYLAYYETNL